MAQCRPCVELERLSEGIVSETRASHLTPGRSLDSDLQFGVLVALGCDQVSDRWRSDLEHNRLLLIVRKAAMKQGMLSQLDYAVVESERGR